MVEGTQRHREMRGQYRGWLDPDHEGVPTLDHVYEGGDDGGILSCKEEEVGNFYEKSGEG